MNHKMVILKRTFTSVDILLSFNVLLRVDLRYFFHTSHNLPNRNDRHQSKILPEKAKQFLNRKRTIKVK